MKNILITAILFIGISSCTSIENGIENNSKTATANVNSSDNSWMSEGTLALTRKMPTVAKIENASSFGFASSTNINVDKSSVKINLKTKEISLQVGEKLSTFKNAILNSYEDLKIQNYTLSMKQANPAWYASDEYFSNRNLSVPTNGNKDRYLKGALGSKAIFLNDTTPIHNADVWCEETKGIQISSEVMEKLYASIDNNSTLEIQ